jgi:uncharacterized protein
MSLYDASVPVFSQMLKGLAGVLVKASVHADSRKIAPEVMLGLRHAPDMFALTRQVQVACDFAKNTCGRLAGDDVPKFSDDEKLRGITFPIQGKPFVMNGADYLHTFALPNFYFHATAAYTILRANGLELNKRDFLGFVAGLKPV